MMKFVMAPCLKIKISSSPVPALDLYALLGSAHKIF